MGKNSQKMVLSFFLTFLLLPFDYLTTRLRLGKKGKTIMNFKTPEEK
jgi:hypothetical protein